MLTQYISGNLCDQVTYSDRYSGLENGRDQLSPSRNASGQKSGREPSGRRADDINAQFGLPKDVTCAERFRLRKMLCASITLVAAGTVGVGSWGIYASVESTEQAVPEFWNVFGQVQDIADEALGLLSQLNSVVTQTEANLSTVIENRGEIQSLASNPAIQQLIGTANPLSQLVNELDPVMAVLRDIKQPIQEAADVANSTFAAGFTEFREDFEPPTLAFQDTWRFVAIGVGFGLLILFALLSSALTVWARFPRLGSTCTILLWAMVALLMFLGAGALGGVKVRRWLRLADCCFGGPCTHSSAQLHTHARSHYRTHALRPIHVSVRHRRWVLVCRVVCRELCDKANRWGCVGVRNQGDQLLHIPIRDK